MLVADGWTTTEVAAVANTYSEMAPLWAGPRLKILSFDCACSDETLADPSGALSGAALA